MRRTAISAAILLLAGYADAYGQMMPIVDKHGTCVQNCPTPDQDLLAQLAKGFPMVPKAVTTTAIRPPEPVGRRVTIGFDPGGGVDEYTARWRKHALDGDIVAVTGGCQSACVLVTAFVPKERICFGEYAFLAFHQATYRETGKLALPASRWMFDHYPIEIQAWIEGKGGVEEMPYSQTQFWVLPAKMLWRMGYRRCE